MLTKDKTKEWRQVKPREFVFNKKEQNIYTRIGELREEQKSASERLDIKIDAISSSVNSMNASLAELTGYLKAKKD